MYEKLFKCRLERLDSFFCLKNTALKLFKCRLARQPGCAASSAQRPSSVQAALLAEAVELDLQMSLLTYKGSDGRAGRTAARAARAVSYFLRFSVQLRDSLSSPLVRKNQVRPRKSERDAEVDPYRAQPADGPRVPRHEVGQGRARGGGCRDLCSGRLTGRARSMVQPHADEGSSLSPRSFLPFLLLALDPKRRSPLLPCLGRR